MDPDPSARGDSRPGPRAVAILTFDGVQSLDVTGPLEVFAQAVECVRKRGGATPYTLELLAERSGPVRTTSGLRRALSRVRGGIDALVVSGGDVALRDLPEWIVEHLGDGLSIERLAERVAMSPRNFTRVFRRERGCTPGKYVEKVRVDAARRFLEDDDEPLEAVATRCGFASSEQMRRTFHRHVGVLPRDYRRRFRTEPERHAS